MNSRKLFPEGKITKKSILNFLDKKGFYIVLILCIAVVGGTAIFVATHNSALSNTNIDSQKIIPEETGDGQVSLTDENAGEILPSETTAINPASEQKPDSGTAAKTADTAVKADGTAAANSDLKKVASADNKQTTADSSKTTAYDNSKTVADSSKTASDNNKTVTDNSKTVTDNSKTVADSNTDKNNNKTASPDTDGNTGANPAGSISSSTVDAADKPAAVQNEASKAISQKFTMPVQGEISFGFAQDRLVYSKTLEEWRTHSGIDIAADRGTAVKATADGVVSEIKNDPRYGVIVIIDHQNGLKTAYANLASDDVVYPNQKIKQGDVIGSVGNTAGFESAEEAHLHFEVWKNDVPVDPTSYLPVKQTV